MNQRGLRSKRGVMKVLVCAGLILLTGAQNPSAPQQSGADVASAGAKSSCNPADFAMVRMLLERAGRT